MKISLQIYGREKTFTEEELVQILEKYFKPPQKPIEGSWFNVNVATIDENLFKEERIDWQQEQTRKHILKALQNVKRNPEKYAKKFKTLVPRKTWDTKSVKELKKLAKSLNGNIANTTEQALEWAQRISNGETWEEICNENDTSKYFRLISANNGEVKLVGGALLKKGAACKFPASSMGTDTYTNEETFDSAVPLIVRYDK